MKVYISKKLIYVIPGLSVHAVKLMRYLMTDDVRMDMTSSVILIEQPVLAFVLGTSVPDVSRSLGRLCSELSGIRFANEPIFRAEVSGGGILITFLKKFFEASNRNSETVYDYGCIQKMRSRYAIVYYELGVLAMKGSASGVYRIDSTSGATDEKNIFTAYQNAIRAVDAINALTDIRAAVKKGGRGEYDVLYRYPLSAFSERNSLPAPAPAADLSPITGPTEQFLRETAEKLRACGKSFFIVKGRTVTGEDLAAIIDVMPEEERAAAAGQIDQAGGAENITQSALLNIIFSLKKKPDRRGRS